MGELLTCDCSLNVHVGLDPECEGEEDPGTRQETTHHTLRPTSATAAGQGTQPRFTSHTKTLMLCVVTFYLLNIKEIETFKW